MPMETIKQFQDFVYSCKFDKFLGRFVNSKAEYAEMWDLMKCLFSMSHGQAAVEWGYSVNKDIPVENLKGRSLIGLCLVPDAMAECAVDEPLPTTL